MTLYGVDVSHYQGVVDWKAVRASGHEFAIIALGDGTFKDPKARTNLDGATAAGLIVAAYHFVRHPSEGTTIAQQVAAILDTLGERRPPLWLDVEAVNRAGVKTLDGATVAAMRTALLAAGVPVVGVYTGRWYWEYMPGGEPSMSGLGALWVSAYGANDGKYPGDLANVWSYPLGDKVPDLLQFTSKAYVPGIVGDVDRNAFRGSRDELQQLLGVAMSTDFDAITRRYRSGVRGSNLEFTPMEFLINADRNSWETLHALEALAAKIDALAAELNKQRGE